MMQKRKDRKMSLSPIERTEMLRIGTVDFVSPDEIKVALDIETPESMAMNAGYPRPFPRVNSYVLIQSEYGFLVGQVEWITIEKSPYPKRQGMKDFGLVDLPYPMRKMSLNPLGMLRNTSNAKEESYAFRRGTEAFPSVGDGVLLPSQKQLKSIVESGENRRVKIGTSPLAGNADVCIDPDRLFGRHLAVLGNTGSGKSCSVVGLIRWSIESAKKSKENPNARFIVLDPNGEYSRAFSTNSGNILSRVFKIDPSQNENQLQVPFWFWDSAEWVAFTQASERTQRPALIHALRAVKEGTQEANVSNSYDMRRYLRTLVSTLRAEYHAGNPWGYFPKPKAFYEKISKWRTGLILDKSFSTKETQSIEELQILLDELISARSGSYPTYDFDKADVENLMRLLSSAHSLFGGSDNDFLPLSADVPRYFTGDALIRSIEASSEMMNVSEYVETMLIRVKSLLTDSQLSSVIRDEQMIDLADWLSKYIGTSDKHNEQISIIDLSLVPIEVIHVVTAVITRIVFEALQRYRQNNTNGKTFPTVLVMEEAHNFVKRYSADSDNRDTAAVCCQVFERVAREGRKFGLGLVLSSQRPSELSPTVLSQCNTFLLHRISNDRDQELVHKLVPDNLRGLLRDLPSLPSQNAILLGWASELPIMVRMNDLPENQTPKSDDPDFWDVWTRSDKGKRDVDWNIIADDWQGRRTTKQ